MQRFHQTITQRFLDRYDRFYHPRHRFGRAHMLMDSVLALLVVGLIGYNGYLFGLRPWLIRPPIELRVHIEPPALSVGGPSTIRVAYAYHGNTIAHDVRIDVDLPSSFELTSATPVEGFMRDTAVWSLGELNPGASGALVLQGSIWSPIGRQEPLSVTANGKMETQSGETRPLATIIEGWIETKLPIVEARVSIPSTVVLNQPTTVSLTLTNTTEVTVPELTIESTLPAGWTTTSATPTLEQGPWAVRALAPGESNTFTLTGLYNTLPESPSFYFSIKRKDGGREVVSARANTTIIDPALELTATTDGASSIEAGDQIPVTITVSNRGEYALEDVAISLAPTGVYVDPSSITAEGGTVTNGVASWSMNQVSLLKQLVPNQHAQFHLTLNTTNNVSLSDRSPLDDFSVLLPPTATFRLSVLPSQTITWYGKTSSIPINTSLGIDAQVQYYTPDGEQVGRGPFPPRVNRKTSYGVRLNVSNTIHDLYETRVQVVVPPNVEWMNRSSVTIGKPITFDTATRTATWTIGRLDNMIGANPKNATAHIELGLTPTPSDIGKHLPIITSITSTGVDGITKRIRNASFAPISTASTAYGAVDGTIKP